MDKISLVCATGQDSFDLIVSNFDEFEIVDTVSYKKDLVPVCIKHQPNLIVVTDNLGGQEYLFKCLIDLRVNCPNTRVVYFCGKIDFSDNLRVAGLNGLIAAGIYDIIEDQEIDVNLIRFILLTPREKSQVDYIEVKYSDSIYLNRQTAPIKFTYNALDEEDLLDSDVFNNLHMFISSKHGSGKSIVVANTAIAIADMGLNKGGSKPRVAIIDLDFENFSLSNIFDSLNDNKNIIKAIEESRRLITDMGIVDDIALQHEVIDNIKKMLIPTKQYSNIKILGGSNSLFKEDEYSRIRENDIVFILETIINDYDIVLVDTNSDAKFEKIFPLFSMSRNVYSVMEMNFNAFQGENRLRGHIGDFLSANKLKYILNKDVDGSSISSKDIEEQLGYEFIAKIPSIDAGTMFNIEIKKDFLINQKDKAFLKTRFEFIKIANDIWPIKNFDVLNEKMTNLFGDSKSTEEEKDYSNPLVGFFMKSFGLDSDNGDTIKDSIKNNKNIEKAKNFSFKGMFGKMSKGVQEISEDEKQQKLLEDKSSTNSQVNPEGGNE